MEAPPGRGRLSQSGRDTHASGHSDGVQRVNTRETRAVPGAGLKTLLLMSVMLFTFAAPIAAARRRDPVRAVRSLFVFFAVFCLLYTLYVSFVHTAFVPQRW
jgi:hypothetical protein